MSKRIFAILLVALTGLALAGRAAAQESGLGAFLDWIHRMSGPQFAGVGASAYYEFAGFPLANQRADRREPGIRLRLSIIERTSVDESEEVDPDDANISMFTVQGMAEIPVPRHPFEFGVGMAANRFGGDADPFWHVSFPIQLQYRDRHLNWEWVPRLGIGVHLFPGFDVQDFEPLDVTVSRDGTEAVLYIFLGLDRRF